MEASMKNLQTSSKKWGQLLLVILISFFSGILGTFTTLQLSQKQNSGTTTTTTVSKTAVKNENSITQAVDKVKDAVVSIITYSGIPKVVLLDLMILIQIRILNKLTVKVLGLSIKKMIIMPTSWPILTLLTELKNLTFV